jgi:uncharacterized protein YcgL (UPF0745 family)
MGIHVAKIKGQKGAKGRQTMKADIYRTNRKDTYLFLPQGNQFSALPQCVLKVLGTLQFWKTMELTPNTASVIATVVELDFQKQRYSIRGAEVMVAESK